MAKITGIGGVFFKSQGASAPLAAWYQQHLGLPLEAFGRAVLRWTDDRAGDGGATAWQVVDHDSDGFGPSASPFMINYRVDDLDALLAQLHADGVAVLAGRRPTTTAGSPGSWIRTGTSWSCGSPAQQGTRPDPVRYVHAARPEA